MGRAPRTKETLPDFLKWCRVTRRPLVFRGLTGSQRAPGFWGVTKLTRKDVKYDWVDACQKSFEELKGRLTSATVLALPNGRDGFVVYSDASR